MSAAKGPKRTVPKVAEMGLDDLGHGIDALLADDPDLSRNRIADKICRYVEGIEGKATRDFCYAVQEFAMLGRDPALVREAFARFVLEAGPAIGEAAYKRDLARRNGKAGAAALKRKSATTLTPLQAAVLRAEGSLPGGAPDSAVSAYIEENNLYRGSTRQSVHAARKQLAAKNALAQKERETRAKLSESKD
jgi:hypothetical protein